MQPLDKTVMGALKTYYSEEIRCFMRLHQRAVTHFDISELFGKAYLKVQSGERAVKGFRMTGIYPCRRDVFTEEDFIAASQVLNTVEHQDKKNAVNEEISAQNQVKMVVLPEDIVPIPLLKKTQGTRGRKSGKAKLITSTPNKEELEESTNQKEKRDSVKKRIFIEPGPIKISLKTSTKNKRKSKPRGAPPSRSANCSSSSSNVSFHDSSDEEMSIREDPDENVECIFCKQKFLDSQKGEMWVECVVCGMWAHEECGGAEKDVYICDFCQ
ncbi:hypothetical protein Zmor_014096 [Zophobas morio]|uniref:Zinc finger PHD-type domain-containing protein n=1 Tax=Zophobas morio TaxID=2755281 RepID=A0AA38IGC2_9CUCU|nr:hypothetical protein Zmor_014096 [Zophobas morio]